MSRAVELVGGPLNGQLRAVPVGHTSLVVQQLASWESVRSLALDLDEPVQYEQGEYAPVDELDDLIDRWTWGGWRPAS